MGVGDNRNISNNNMGGGISNNNMGGGINMTSNNMGGGLTNNMGGGMVNNMGGGGPPMDTWNTNNNVAGMTAV